MKGAIVLVLMLLMGFITAQSIEAMGYEITHKDRIYLQNIFATIEKKGHHEQHLSQKFVPYLNYFPTNSRQYKLLHEIYNHIQEDPTHIPADTDTIYTQDMIELLGKQF